MAPLTTIPVTITPSAAARIEQLGMQRELQTMIDHTRETISGLEEIIVETWDDPSEPGEPHISIEGWRTGRWVPGDRPEHAWVSWFVNAFHPDVLRWFSFDLLYRDEHGR